MRTLRRSPTSLKDAAVELRGVTRLFGAAPALVRVDLAIERHVVGNRCRDADPKIDVPAFGNITRHAGGHRFGGHR